MQECVSEYISFVTSEASERCTAERRKTINGEDIIFALQNLGFDAYIEPLQKYLERYREDAKANDQKKAAGGGGGVGAGGGVGEADGGNYYAAAMPMDAAAFDQLQMEL